MALALVHSSTSADVREAYDQPTAAVVEIGRNRHLLRDLGTGTTDPEEAWRIARMLEEEALALQAARELVLHRHDQLEGR